MGYLTINRRVIFEGGIYHITQRAPGREIIFLEDSDYLFFLKTSKEVVGTFNLQLFCFALLPNHVHLLLQIKEKNLSVAMKALFETYAKFFNKKYARKGHVFCGRYRASVCSDDNYLLSASIYIHLNPVRAGLCQTANGHRWSSLDLYIGAERKSFLFPDKILGLIGRDCKDARTQYAHLIENALSLKGGVLIESKTIRDNIAQIKKLVTRSSDLDDLISRLKIELRKTNEGSKKAQQYVIEQLLSQGYSRQEAAEKMGISRMTAYRVLSASNVTKAV